MKRIIFFLLLAGSCLMLPATSKASVLKSLLSLDGGAHYDLSQFNTPFQGGGEDKLQDDSLSQFVKGSGNVGAGFEVGDIIWGILTLSDVLSSGRPNATLGPFPPGQVAFVFSAKVASLNGGSNGTIDLAPIGDATDNYDLRKLLDPTVQNSLSDSTILTVLSTTTPATANNNNADPLNWAPGQVTTDFTTANNWNWELTADLVAGTDDFFEFSNVGPGLAGLDRGGLTIVANAFGVAWTKVDAFDFGGTIRKSDIVLDFGSVNIASGVEAQRGWTFTDQSTFYVNPLPEPVSALVWGGLLSIFALAIRSSRRRSAR
jgi:hypothetical protein